MLVDVITQNGSYKKYQPTKEEIIKLFSECVTYSFIKPFELPEILEINLRKWNMLDYYCEILNSLGLEEYYE